MNANPYNTMNYEIFLPLAGQKNKPNSNPNKPNLQKAKMNINSITTKDYRKKDDFEVRINKPKTNPISVKPKMSANLYVLKDYENETTFRPKKTNPTCSELVEPIQTQFLQKAKMNVNFCAAGYYESKPTFAVRKGRWKNEKRTINHTWQRDSRCVVRCLSFIRRNVWSKFGGSAHEKQFRKSEPTNVQACLQTDKGGSFFLTFFAQSGKLLVAQGWVVS